MNGGDCLIVESTAESMKRALATKMFVIVNRTQSLKERKEGRKEERKKEKATSYKRTRLAPFRFDCDRKFSPPGVTRGISRSDFHR